MSCRDNHATTVFAFIIALISAGGIITAMLIPQWRVTRLISYNRNSKNATVYDGLWAKCVQLEGTSGCYVYDKDWYARVDQLDLRVLQFALPLSLLFSSLSLLLSMCGMCKTACCTDKPEAATVGKCQVNSSGCHLVAGMLLFISGGIAMAPSVWFLFYTKEMNKRYDQLFSDDFAVYVSIGCSGGLILAALMLFMWYCMCKKLPSPFWLPLPQVSNSFSTQALTANGYPSPTYAPQPAPVTQGYPTLVATDPRAYLQPQAYAQSVAPPQVYPTQPVYMSQVSAPDGYSEVGYAQSYAPSQAYSAYGGQRYPSRSRSRMSAIEIDIPVLTQAE